MNYKETYDFWLNSPIFDEETKSELLAIKDNETEMEDRFCKELDFGTGGLRGVIGAGTNRINFYTVRKATQGLANFILSQKKEANGVAIAYDSRRFSKEFALEAALCLAANNIKAYLFDALRPTPELSFAVRELGCCAGIVITASHNPPEYNGYKVYWEDGAQITAPKDTQIIDEVKAVTDYNLVKTMIKEDAMTKGLLEIIGEAIDDRYMEELKKQLIDPDMIQTIGKDLKIVYSPFNGAGNVPVRRVLKEIGFENVYVVKEQEEADGNFPTLEYPNPEDPKAFVLALKLAKEVDADIILATDPDADRLGIYALDQKTKEYIAFTGNMSGMLIAEYLMREKKAKNSLPANAALVKTIVTTNMADVMAKKYGVTLISVLTGFKYIGEQIKFFEETGSNEYIFGLEESYGCLAGTHARDKDAVVAAMCLCEVAAFCKSQDSTLWDMMVQMYDDYGYFKEGLHTVTLKGIAGTQKIGEMMEAIRSNPFTELDGLKVLTFSDYEMDTCKDMITGSISSTNLPKSNVLYFELENDSWCCARPSGTEPKIKFYMGVKGTSLQDSDQKLESLTNALLAKIDV